MHTFLLEKSRTSTKPTRCVPGKMGVQSPTASSGLEHAEDISSIPHNRSKEHSWRAVRRTVSYILRRDPKKETGKDRSLPSSAPTVLPIISSPRALKPSKSASSKLTSSSTSIPTQRPYRYARPLTISPPPRVFVVQQAQALTQKQRLRRSRSFSGYPNGPVAIAEECSDFEMDAELDEATLEAQEVMKDISRKRAFSRIEEVHRERRPDVRARC
ncbi:hypothetical protein J132_09634 [Termitomyces sp. J132]|nr:hypothetical protein H2248_011178 [Termitomyces sp. 'cryptogamus']KNZ79483.1 hypothetical protein J132_09634 [Termitomyces sp. J132]